MFVIDNELKEFLESGVAVLVGRVAADGKPRVGYAWGPRVHADGTRLSIYIERARVAPVLSGQEMNPQIAATFTDAVSVRSIQVKGRILEVDDANEAEQAWVARHREAVQTTTSLIGDPPYAIRNMWMEGPCVRIDFSVERAFDQTPGPNAGAAL